MLTDGNTVFDPTRKNLSAASRRFLFLWKFSCHTIHERRINDDSVKAIRPARRHLVRLSRVGPCLGMCGLLVFVSCKKNEPIDEAKAAGKSTADFPQITADIFKPMDGGIDLSPEGNHGPQYLEPLERW